MRFTVAADSTGRPSWWLYGANNKLMAWAGMTFASSTDAARAADHFRSKSVSADFDVVSGAGNRWLWQAWFDGELVAVSTVGCTTKQNACRAAHNVRDHAGGAFVPPTHDRNSATDSIAAQ